MGKNRPKRFLGEFLPRSASRRFLMYCPQLFSLPFTSACPTGTTGRNAGPMSLLLDFSYSRTHSSVDNTFIVGIFLPGAVVTPTVFDSAARAGLDGCAFEEGRCCRATLQTRRPDVFTRTVPTASIRKQPTGLVERSCCATLLHVEFWTRD